MKLAVVRNFFEDRHATLADKLAAAESELSAAQAAFDAAALRLTDAEGGDNTKAAAEAVKAHATAANRLEDAKRHVLTLQAAQRAAAAEADQRTTSEAQKALAATRKALREDFDALAKLGNKIEGDIEALAADAREYRDLCARIAAAADSATVNSVFASANMMLHAVLSHKLRFVPGVHIHDPFMTDERADWSRYLPTVDLLGWKE
jgi:hypothetical protein